MGYFDHHVFFCCNQRANGEACCANHDALTLRNYAKDKLKKDYPQFCDAIRVNTAGCLDRCDLGPVLVIYPEAVWYTYTCTDDIDEILERHIGKGEIVKRLQLPDRNK